MRRFDQALGAYEQAITLDPNDASVWYNKGVALGELKRYQEALAAYDRALALFPTFAAVWNNKGHALLDLKRYDDALVAFDRALALERRQLVDHRPPDPTASRTET